jgi:hypothetical protein
VRWSGPAPERRAAAGAARPRWRDEAEARPGVTLAALLTVRAYDRLPG